MMKATTQTIFFRNSIQIKISAMLIVLTTVLFSGYGAYQFWTLQSNSLSHLNELADSVIARLTENLAKPIWDADDLQVQKVVISEMREKNILSIQVKNDKERLLTGKGRDSQWQVSDLQATPTGDAITRHAPIDYEGRGLGAINLSLTKQFMQADLRHALKILFVTLLVLDVALLLGLTLSLRQMLVRPLAFLLTIAEAIARGDFSREIHIRQQDEIGALVHAFQTMIAKLIQVVQDVKTAVNTIAKNSQELSLSAQTLSEGTSQHAAATEETSASMEEMAANIRQNADHARQTETLARQAVAYAEESGHVVAETVIAMQQIADQISVVQDIAQQTRLLSLNATIEASRAQDYGKAFGVVAHEVRELADTSRVAAETIAKLTNSSLDISAKAGTMLGTLVPNIQKTAELVQEISAASAEQATGVEQINRAVQQLDRATQMTAATAEEVASAAETLTNQAEQLQQTIAFFTLPETSAEFSATDGDLLTTLQTLAAKGASEHALGALVKSMLSTTAPEPSGPEQAPAAVGQGAPQQRPAGEPLASASQGPALDLSPQAESRDARDDEFERY